jgi:hypothetical protein
MDEKWETIKPTFFTPDVIDGWRRAISMFEDVSVISLDAENKGALKKWLSDLVDTNGGNSMFMVRCKAGYICVTSNSNAGRTVACFIRDALTDAVKSRTEIAQLRVALALALAKNQN